MQKIRSRKLAPWVGAEILDVDIRYLDDEMFCQVLETWFDHNVILIRGQDLDEASQTTFAERFGPLGKVHHPQARPHHPAIMYISNIRENGELIGTLPDGEMHFHSDQTYLEEPCAATMLYAMEIPRVGGDTVFSNAYRAYETLESSLKERIDRLRAINAYDNASAATARGTTLAPGVPRASHPVVRTHPVTGRKSLYVNRLMTVAIEGLGADESEALLDLLFDHAECPELIYAHRWQPGDLVLWDNRCTLHARTDFSAKERRLLRRVVILGDKPE